MKFKFTILFILTIFIAGSFAGAENYKEALTATDIQWLKENKVQKSAGEAKKVSISRVNLLNDPFNYTEIERAVPAEGTIYTEAASMEEALSLTAIFHNEAGSAAIINGKILNKGDYINGRQVQEISKNEVSLSGKNGTLVMKVNKFVYDVE